MGQRFQNHHSTCIVQAREKECVMSAVYFEQLFAWEFASPDDMIGNPKLLGQLLKLVPRGSVADNRQCGIPARGAGGSE